MDYKKILKQGLIYVGIIVFFWILAYAYAPQVLSGKVVNQSDTSGWIGMSHEVAEYNAAHPDDKTQWTNSMFGGMPTAAMYDDFSGDWTNPLYKGLMGLAGRPVNFLLISLIGAFLMLLAFGVDKWLAVAGAVAVTFCAYNLQIIQVGHNTKMQAIAFAPWVIAGVVFTYRSTIECFSSKRKKSAVENGSDELGWKSWLPTTVLGSVLFALALSFQVKANHPQITYYLAILIFVYVITLFIWLCATKERRRLIVRFFVASALLLVVGGVGIATNLNKLLPTVEYGKYSMRGGSELSSASGTENESGLDIAYATSWSYGVEETPNLLIPDFNGGASAGELGRDSETYKLLQSAGQSNLESVRKALPLYWGPQPFTAGPMYMGAITVFLFILGLCLHKGKEKWWLAVAVVIAVFLAWGSHFLWFTRLWFNYVPLYNKFRTVSMALVILQLALPVLGFIVLNDILKDKYERKVLLKGLGIATGITAGFCLIFILIPSLAGSFVSASDAGMADVLTKALAIDRRHLLVSDAWRSFGLVALTAVLLYFLFGRKSRYSQGATTGTLAAALCLMMVFDLWGVGKRYLNGDHFVNKRDFTGQFSARAVDEMIKEDEDPSYRVLDISVSTFNDSFTSYHHKSIGGYSPVKLQRYQDLISAYLTSEVNAMIRTVNNSSTVSEVQENMPYLPIVSALNGRYVILGDDYAPIVNEYALGNAWFVGEFFEAATPDDELEMLASTDLGSEAVIGADFWANIGLVAPAEDDDYIMLTEYAPNELHYYFKTAGPRAVIFSEIYYPEGWTLTYIPSSGTAAVGGNDGVAASGSAVENGKSSKESQNDDVGTATSGSSVRNDKSTKGSQNAEEIDIFRADWILRGAMLPAGEGELVMRFDPQCYKTGERASRASSITLLILLLLSVGFYGFSRRGEAKQ